jgi:hypothetical protein
MGVAEAATDSLTRTAVRATLEPRPLRPDRCLISDKKAPGAQPLSFELRIDRRNIAICR